MRKVLHVCPKPHITYVDRLNYLCLNSLELQPLHIDLTEMFKIVEDFSCPSLKNALR